MLRKIKSVVSCQLSVVRKEIPLCLLSAFFLILSLPNFNLWIFAWFGFVPLFLAIKDKSKIRAFFLAYLTGVIFWLGTIYWLIHVTLPGMIILVLYLALYFGIFGLIFRNSTLYALRSALLFIPSLWVLLEYLRSHIFTGFPWALLGYSQYLNLPIIQFADITGVWGVSFLVMMVNVAICQLVSEVRSQKSEFRKKIFCFLFSVFCFLFVIGYGYHKICQTPNTKHQTPIRISVIQGNIPQELKWSPNSKDFIMDRYFSLTKQALADNPDLIIWPEAALPVVLEEEPEYFEKVRDFVKQTKIPLLLGAVTSQNNFYYNSALLVSNEGKLLSRYDKLHLVPFGEYIPLRKAFGFLETIVPIGDFTAGREYTLFKTQDKFSVLICFEDLFPQISRGFVKNGADFLVNITNDAWFGKTASPYQHLCASVFRAIENRTPLVRSANTGVSGFIAPSGKIISLVQDRIGENIFISGYRTQEMAIPTRDLSFYTRYGDIFIFLLFIFIIYSIFRLVPKPGL